MAENIVDLQCPLCGNDAPAGREKCDCGYKFANGGGSADAVEWSPGMVTPGALGDGWRTGGFTLCALGAIGLVMGFFMSTTVSTSGAYGLPTDVVNLDRQFYKGLAIDVSLFAIGLGVFCAAVGAILDAIGRRSG